MMIQLLRITLVISIISIVWKIKEAESVPFKIGAESFPLRIGPDIRPIIGEKQVRDCDKTRRHRDHDSASSVKCDCPCCRSGITDPSKRCSECKKNKYEADRKNKDCKPENCPKVTCKSDEKKVRRGCCETCKKIKDHNSSDSKPNCSLVLCARPICKPGEIIITKKGSCCPECAPNTENKNEHCVMPMCMKGYHITPWNTKYGRCPVCITQADYDKEFKNKCCNSQTHEDKNKCSESTKPIDCPAIKCAPGYITVTKSRCPECVLDCSLVDCALPNCKDDEEFEQSPNECCPKCVKKVNQNCNCECPRYTREPEICSKIKVKCVVPKCEADECQVRYGGGQNRCCPTCVKKNKCKKENCSKNSPSHESSGERKHRRNHHSNSRSKESGKEHNDKSKCECTKYKQQPEICKDSKIGCPQPLCKLGYERFPYGSGPNGCCPTCVDKSKCKKRNRSRNSHSEESSRERKRDGRKDCKSTKNRSHNSNSRSKESSKEHNDKSKCECTKYKQQPEICKDSKIGCPQPLCKFGEERFPYGSGPNGCCPTCVNKSKCKKGNRPNNLHSPESSKEGNREGRKDCKRTKNRSHNSNSQSKESGKEVKPRDCSKVNCGIVAPPEKCDDDEVLVPSGPYKCCRKCVKKVDLNNKSKCECAKYKQQPEICKQLKLPCPQPLCDVEFELFPYGSGPNGCCPTCVHKSKCKRNHKHFSHSSKESKEERKCNTSDCKINKKKHRNSKECSKERNCDGQECKSSKKKHHNSKSSSEERIKERKCDGQDCKSYHGPDCKCKHCSKRQPTNKCDGATPCKMIPECTNPGEVLSCKIERYNCCQKCISNDDYKKYCEGVPHQPHCKCHKCNKPKPKECTQCHHEPPITPAPTQPPTTFTPTHPPTTCAPTEPPTTTTPTTCAPTQPPTTTAPTEPTTTTAPTTCAPTQTTTKPTHKPCPTCTTPAPEPCYDCKIVRVEDCVEEQGRTQFNIESLLVS